MRSIWKGAISFGLVNIPVRLYPAIKKQDLHLRMLHSVCHTPIKYDKVCPTCQRPVLAEEITRGYEFSRGRFVTLDDDVLDNLPLPTAKTIEILDFVNMKDIDPIYFDTPYYLEPAEQGNKAYSLLRRAMLETGQVAMSKVVIRTRENLAVLRVMDRALLLSTMYYPDEIRGLDQLEGLTDGSAISDNELKMAVSLVGNLSTGFDPSRYTNNYRKALQEVINRKIEGQEVEEAPVPVHAEVIDLIDALKASLAATSPQPGGQP